METLLYTFLLSFYYWFLVWFYCGQRKHFVKYQFFKKIVELFFNGLQHGLSRYVLCALENNVFFCCWVGYYINVCYILLIVLLSSSMSLLILPNGYIKCWERGVDVSNSNCKFVYFSFQFYPFLCHIFCVSFAWCI